MVCKQDAGLHWHSQCKTVPTLQRCLGWFVVAFSFFVFYWFFSSALHVCKITESPLTMGVAAWSHHYIHSSVSLFLWDEDSASDFSCMDTTLFVSIFDHLQLFLCESQPEKVLVFYCVLQEHVLIHIHETLLMFKNRYVRKVDVKDSCNPKHLN